MDRFWIGVWGGVEEVLDRFLRIILISLSYFFTYHVGKDLGMDLERIWTDFEMMFDSSLNASGGHVGAFFCYYTLYYHSLLHFILSFCQSSFQIMRSPCQEECEADVSILLRSRRQNEFQIMRSLCQE